MQAAFEEAPVGGQMSAAEVDSKTGVPCSRFKMYRSVLIIQSRLLPSPRVNYRWSRGACGLARTHTHTHTRAALWINKPIDGYQCEGSSLHCLLNFITRERAAAAV